MKLMHAITTPNWMVGMKMEVSRCEECHRSVGLRSFSARKAGIRMDGAWYCSSSCFVLAAEREIVRLLTSRTRNSGSFNRMPLGMVLLSKGLLTAEQWRNISEKQKETGGEIDDLLIQHASLSEEQITAARASQWGCPLFSVFKQVAVADFHIPRTLIQRYSAVPLHYVAAKKLLLVGFVQRVEYGLLYLIEKMSDLKTQPCFVTPSDFQTQCRHVTRGDGQARREITFEEVRNSAQMARTLCEYGVDLEADEATIGRCKEYLWARLKCGSKDVDLLFRAA